MAPCRCAHAVFAATLGFWATPGAKPAVAHEDHTFSLDRLNVRHQGVGSAVS